MVIIPTCTVICRKPRSYRATDFRTTNITVIVQVDVPTVLLKNGTYLLGFNSFDFLLIQEGVLFFVLYHENWKPI